MRSDVNARVLAVPGASIAFDDSDTAFKLYAGFRTSSDNVQMYSLGAEIHF